MWKHTNYGLACKAELDSSFCFAFSCGFFFSEALDKLLAEESHVRVENEELVAEYYHLKHRLESYATQMRRVVTKPIHCLPFLQPGRLIRVVSYFFFLSILYPSFE